jgi:hypothetical protein
VARIARWQSTPYVSFVRAGYGRIDWKPTFRIGAPTDFPSQLVLNKTQ